MPRDRYQRGHLKPVGKHIKKWRGWWFTYERKDGTEVRVHHSQILGLKAGMTKGEAQAKLDTIIQAATAQTPSATQRITLRQFITDVYVPVRKKNWEPNTRKSYNGAINNHILPALGDIALADLTKARIEKHLLALAEDGAGKDTLGRVLMLLRAALTDAVENGYIPKSPAHKAIMPKVDGARGTRYLSLDEVDRLFSRLSGRDRLVWRILVLCGTRAYEPFALRRDDVSGSVLRIDEQLRVDGIKPVKDKEPRLAPMPASLAVEMRMWMETVDRDPRALLFGDTNQSAEYARLDEMREKTGITDLTYAMGRRTFSTHFEGDLKDVQDILGHSKPEITVEHYKMSVPERQLVAVERLDALYSGRELVTTGHRNIAEANNDGGSVN